MLTMPIAGQLADRTGIGRIVLVGMVADPRATLALTQIAADTSYWTLSAVLFVFGMGMGSTMMPIMTGALQTLRKAAVARASTTLNILQQVGASIGTAVMTVILTNALAERAPSPAAAAGAFGETFWWALGLLLVAFIAAFLLPRSKPEPVADEDETEEHVGTVLIHA